MHVEVINNAGDFLALERPWNDCLATMRGGNPFLCHQWLRTWWASFGQGAELMVLLVRDGEDIRAAAPLFRVRRPYYGLPLEQILFLGTHTFDRLRFLVRGPDDESMRALWRFLQSAASGRTLVRLEGLPVDDPTIAASEELPGLWAQERSSCLPYIPIDRSWDDYRKGLTHKFRSEMRTRGKVFASWGEWRLDTCRGAGVRPHLAELAALESASAKLKKGAAFLADARNFEFMSALLTFTEPVEPVLLRLLVGDQLIAYVLGFIHADIYCAYNTAYHPGYEKGSPGKWILDQAVSFAFAEGLTEFDFLRGQFSYKERWRPQARYSCRRLLFPTNLPGRVLRSAVFEMRPRLKTILHRGTQR